MKISRMRSLQPRRQQRQLRRSCQLAAQRRRRRPSPSRPATSLLLTAAWVRCDLEVGLWKGVWVVFLKLLVLAALRPSAWTLQHLSLPLTPLLLFVCRHWKRQ